VSAWESLYADRERLRARVAELEPQIATVTRERDELRAENSAIRENFAASEARSARAIERERAATTAAHEATERAASKALEFAQLKEAIERALGERCTGDLAADVRRLVEEGATASAWAEALVAAIDPRGDETPIDAVYRLYASLSRTERERDAYAARIDAGRTPCCNAATRCGRCGRELYPEAAPTPAPARPHIEIRDEEDGDPA
jgi:regulator of replication initiation timing